MNIEEAMKWADSSPMTTYFKDTGAPEMLAAEVRRLRERIATLEADAARYRFIRDPCSGAEDVIHYNRGDYGNGMYSHTALDDVIDAAIGKGESVRGDKACPFCNPSGVFNYSPMKDCICQGKAWLWSLPNLPAQSNTGE